MAHLLDRNSETGELAYVGRQSAWHREGVVIPEGFGLDEAMEKGGLDWEVEKVPAFFQREKEVKVEGWQDRYETVTEHILAPSSFLIIRSDRDAPLGMVGDTYHPLQNSEAFGVLRPLIDSELAFIETAGSLREGRDVWMLVGFDIEKVVERAVSQVPRENRAEAERLLRESFEEVVPFGLITNNHAGERKVTLKETPIRVVCANTLHASLSKKDSALTIEAVHSKSVKKNVEKGAELLFGGIANRYLGFADLRETLRGLTPLTDMEFDRLVLDPAVPIRHLERKIQRHEGRGSTHHALEVAHKKRATIRDLWANGDGHEGDRSAWEAMNGLVQALDHDEQWSPRSKTGSRLASLHNGTLSRVKAQVTNRLVGYAQSKDRAGMLAGFK